MKLVLLALLVFSLTPAIHAQTRLTIKTEPNAVVWIDEIRRGTTDETGTLSLTKLSPGRHSVRIRATGFKETVRPLAAGRRALTVKLVRTTDEAELLFQQAEAAREKARDDPAMEKAAELYREAIKRRPAYPEAHVGLARILMDLNEFREAHAEIEAARRTRPAYAEASAIEGRIYREEAFADDALRSFRRAIKEGGGVQPEAYVGMARVSEDQGRFNDAIAQYKKALTQLADSEPVIYQLLGAAYEQIENPKEAVVAYEKYLELSPNGSYASAIRSILQQLKREAAGEQIIP